MDFYHAYVWEDLKQCFPGGEVNQNKHIRSEGTNLMSPAQFRPRLRVGVALIEQEAWIIASRYPLTGSSGDSSERLDNTMAIGDDILNWRIAAGLLAQIWAEPEPLISNQRRFESGPSQLSGSA